MGRLAINGDEIYELDEECLREKQKQNRLKKQSLSEKERTFRTSGVREKNIQRPQG